MTYVVAVLIGIAFGFVLERAGFGRADKLAAQFYLRDMRVFKVMFTAIVTAMLGMVIVSGAGLVNLREASESIASFTWVWPMLIGGLVLGVGFIVSGYCPGTSIVSAASGNVDGAFTVAGVITGTLVYGALLKIQAFSAFHNSSEKGSWFLYDLAGVSPQWLAAAVALAAVLAFVGAEKVESLMGGPRTAARVRRYAFATVGVLAVTSVITLSIPAPEAAAGERARAIRPAELAQIVVEEPWRVRIDGNSVAIDDQPRALAGGMAAYRADPLVKALTSGAPPPPPRAATGAVIAKPKKKGGGCSA
jgi:uncharacterized membrane protein YedE/YeeE